MEGLLNSKAIEEGRNGVTPRRTGTAEHKTNLLKGNMCSKLEGRQEKKV